MSRALFGSFSLIYFQYESTAAIIPTDLRTAYKLYFYLAAAETLQHFRSSFNTACMQDTQNDETISDGVY